MFYYNSYNSFCMQNGKWQAFSPLENAKSSLNVTKPNMIRIIINHIVTATPC